MDFSQHAIENCTVTMLSATSSVALDNLGRLLAAHAAQSTQESTFSQRLTEKDTNLTRLLAEVNTYLQTHWDNAAPTQILAARGAIQIKQRQFKKGYQDFITALRIDIHLQQLLSSRHEYTEHADAFEKRAVATLFNLVKTLGTPEHAFKEKADIYEDSQQLATKLLSTSPKDEHCLILHFVLAHIGMRLEDDTLKEKHCDAFNKLFSEQDQLAKHYVGLKKQIDTYLTPATHPRSFTMRSAAEGAGMIAAVGAVGYYALWPAAVAMTSTLESVGIPSPCIIPLALATYRMCTAPSRQTAMAGLFSVSMSYWLSSSSHASGADLGQDKCSSDGQYGNTTYSPDGWCSM